MHHFNISHWEREASRLRRVVKRRHRTEQLLFTGWFTYTNSELSALKEHHRRRKQSIITVVFLFFNLKRMESERGRASLAFSIHNKGAECFLRTVWTKWKPCFFLPSTACYQCSQAIILALSWPLPCFLHPPHTHFISVLFEVTFLNKMNFTVRRVRTSMRVSC